MNKEEIATTYEEYKNGFELVAGLGRLSCYQGLYYLNKLLEEDKYYSEKLEDSIVFIESHINRIEKENKKHKEVIDKAIEYLTSYSSIHTIQFGTENDSLNDIELNKTLDEKTLNEMTNRYLKVHDKLLEILKERE